MMKRSFPLLGALVLLASCAPAVTGPVQGRIVNSRTGQEGTVSFVRGTLQTRPSGAPVDNAVLQIGGQTYTGRTAMINSGTVATPSNWGLGLGFGFGSGRHHRGFFDWGARYDTFDRGTPTYTGNLIAKTGGPRPRTLTCQLTVDAYERGVGTCVDNDNVSYALQF